MKSIKYIIIASVAAFILAACEKKDYPAGVPELEHHYYAIFVPNNNTLVSVNRTAGTLKFPVQFYSTFTRNYVVTTAGITNPAVKGQDFDIVDKNGNVIPTTDTPYSIIFPQAIQKLDTI